MPANDRYWEQRPLHALSAEEWEGLCDGCGRCCLHKLQDRDTGRVEWTDVICPLSDPETAHCTDYTNRRTRVPACLDLRALSIAEFTDTLAWMPPTCAYRLLAEGRPLPDWHPLVSGDPDSVLRAGVSVIGRTRRPGRDGDGCACIVSWPGEWPRVARR